MTKFPLSVVRNVRFQSHPTRTACWIWTAKSPKLTHQGIERSARQTIYRLVYGDAPKRLDDLCGENQCVNPHHMVKR